MTKKKILIVDDEESFTTLIKTSLEARGKYEVKTENNGSSAVATARAFEPDLILLDILMPGSVNGDEIARRIKNEEKIKNVPIVFVTAVVTEEEVVSRGDVIGGHPFIAKPVHIEKLIACIEKALS